MISWIKKLFVLIIVLILLIFLLFQFFLKKEIKYSKKDIIKIVALSSYSKNIYDINLLQKKYYLFDEKNQKEFDSQVQNIFKDETTFFSSLKKINNYFINKNLKKRNFIAHYYHDDAYLSKHKKFNENLLIKKVKEDPFSPLKEFDKKEKINLPDNYLRVFFSEIEIFSFSKTAEKPQIVEIMNIFEVYKNKKLESRFFFNDHLQTIKKEDFINNIIKTSFYYDSKLIFEE